MSNIIQVKSAVRYHLNERMDQNDMLDYIEDTLGLQAGSTDNSELRDTIWNEIKDSEEKLREFADNLVLNIEDAEERDPLEPTNEQRAAWADAAIQAYNAAKGEVVDEDTAKDLISDILHWMDSKNIRNPLEVLQTSIANYEAEA